MQNEKLAIKIRQVVLENDLPALVAMANRSSKKYHDSEPHKVDKWQREFETPGFSLADDVRCAEYDGQIIGIIEVWNTTPPYVQSYAWFVVDPAFEGQGIAEQLLAWAESRATEKIALAPDDAKIEFGSGGSEKNEMALASLQAAGLELKRKFYTMRIDFRETTPQPPIQIEGVSIRPMHMDTEKEAVYRAFDDSFKDHWGYVEEPFEEAYARFEHSRYDDPDFDPDIHWVADVEGEIAAVCLCRKESHEDPNSAWISIVGTRRAYRRRGIAKALLLQAFDVFHKRGKDAAELGVDASSLTDATKLYRGVGMDVKEVEYFYAKTLRDGRDYQLTGNESED